MSEEVDLDQTDALDTAPVLRKIFQPLAKKLNDRVSSGDNFFSIEVYPPRTRRGAAKLLAMFVQYQ